MAATVEVPTTVSSGAKPASEEEDVPGDGNKVVQWKQVALNSRDTSRATSGLFCCVLTTACIMSRQAFVHPPYLSIYVVLIVVFQEATAATVEVPTTVSSGAIPASEEEDVPGDGNKVSQ